MVENDDFFSVGKLEVGGLEMRVRYRRTQCLDDVFSTTVKKPQQQLSPSSTTTSNVSQQDLQNCYDESSREGSSEVCICYLVYDMM